MGQVNELSLEMSFLLEYRQYLMNLNRGTTTQYSEYNEGILLHINVRLNYNQPVTVSLLQNLRAETSRNDRCSQSSLEQTLRFPENLIQRELSSKRRLTGRFSKRSFFVK